MTDEKALVYDCNDKNLGHMLQKLFDEGHDEVVVRHPIDAPVVVTRADFKKYLREIERCKNMSPADRVKEGARLKNIKNQKQIRFRTAMLNAPAYTIDPDDEESFGKDIDGNEMDIRGMVFVPIVQYLKGIEVLEHELGCFVDEYDEKRSPVRILQKTDSENSPAGGGDVTPAGEPETS